MLLFLLMSLVSPIGRNPSAFDVSLAVKAFAFAASPAPPVLTVPLGLVPTVLTP